MSKAEELINATELVKKMLEHYPEARNSDDDLYLLVCRAINIEILHLPFGLVMRQRKKYKLPAFETVRRTRQLFSEAKAKEIIVKTNKISRDISSLMAIMEMIEDLNLEQEYKRWKEDN